MEDRGRRQNTDRQHDKKQRQGDDFPIPAFAAGGRADHQHECGGDDNAGAFNRGRKCRDCREHKYQGPGIDTFNAMAFNVTAAQRQAPCTDDQAEQGEKHAKQEGKVTRPHPHRTAHRIVTGERCSENSEKQENQPGKEIPGIVNSETHLLPFPLMSVSVDVRARWGFPYSFTRVCRGANAVTAFIRPVSRPVTRTCRLAVHLHGFGSAPTLGRFGGGRARCLRKPGFAMMQAHIQLPYPSC